MKKWFRKPIDTFKHSELESRFFIVIILTGIVIAIAGSISNILLDFGMFSTIQNLVVAVICIAALYFALATGKYILLSKVMLTMLTFVLYPIIWFSEGGLDGSATYLYIMNIALIAVMLSKHRPFALLVANLLVFLTLVFIQFNYPSLIRFHATDQIRIIDNASMAIITIVAVYFIVTQILKDYSNKIDQLNTVQSLLRRQSTTDSLTNLRNRRHIISEMERKLPNRRNTALSLVMVDIDHFKSINDTYGHSFGDTVIKEIAAILRQHVRQSDTVARFGGEEFMLLLEQADCHQAQLVAEQIQYAIKHHGWKHTELRVTASFGVFEINGNMDPDSAIDSVDQLLYKAKAAGRDCIISNSDSLRAASAKRPAADDLFTRPQFVDQAISTDQQGISYGVYGPFTLRSAYQPIVTTNPNNEYQAVAYEGLIRPFNKHQPVSPLSFFRQVKPEDRFFIEWLCRALHMRNAFSLQQANLKLFINLDPGLYNDQQQTLREINIMLDKMRDLGLGANNIVIEIMETKASDDNLLIAMVERFRELDVGIAIDDYGAMYSDSTRISNLRPDYVKIDGDWFNRHCLEVDFVSNLKNTHAELESKGIHIIYEGIETESGLAIAKACGAKYFQCFLTGTPELAGSLL